MKQRVKDAAIMQKAAFRKPSSKTAGTRAGILLDWREGDRKLGKTSGIGKTLRDGR